MDLLALIFAVAAMLLLLVMCGGIAMFFFTARTDDPATTLNSGLIAVVVDIVAAIFFFFQQLATILTGTTSALPSIIGLTSSVAIIVRIKQDWTRYSPHTYRSLLPRCPLHTNPPSTK